MTSRARTTTPTCMSRRRFRCSRIGPVSARSRRSWATGTRTTPRRAGRTRTRPSFCIEPVDALSPAQFVTSTPSGRRACTSSICRSCPCPSSLPLDDEPLDPCEADSAERNGPDQAQVEALCLAQGFPPELLPDYDNRFDVARGFAGGNPDLDPETADTLTVRRGAHLAVRQPVARPPAGLARLVPDRDRRRDRHGLLPMNSSRAASTGRSILHSKCRTNGAGCSPAIRRAATSSMPTRSCATARGCGRPGWTCSSTGASISGG